ncbi:MAG: DUF6084 family protein [Acidimicrobiia bacterium]
MTELVFDCVGARAERWAVSPTLTFIVKVAETAGEAVHGIALRCQIRIEPVKRRYSDDEGEKLADLFGERSRWGETMKPLQLAFAAQMVPSFSGSAEFELPVPFTYDFEVATSKYFHALGDGDIPLLLLFSGTIFVKTDEGFRVEQVPWHKEATFRLPVATWREMMDAHFPNSAWVRVRRDTLDALTRFRSERALSNWDDTITALLGESAPR